MLRRSAELVSAGEFLTAHQISTITSLVFLVTIDAFYRGGWVLSHVLSSELADDFVAGSVPHPSMQLEGALFQRDVNALFDTVKKPMILLNAKVSILYMYIDVLCAGNGESLLQCFSQRLAHTLLFYFIRLP